MSESITPPRSADCSSDEEIETKSHEHTLPASWWVSQKIYDIERRAIFSKTWLFVTHRSRFNKPGDYHSFEIAGFPFFLILGRDSIVRGFHNVCRHRAYPVIRKEKGTSTVIGCKYHGWSYDTKGKLLKAPQFDGIAGFDKAKNSLFEIHTNTTPQGLIFVNFDSTSTGPVPFDKWFQGLQGEMNEFDFEDYEYHSSYTLDGSFNWKTLMDGYQECYHCPTAHPGLSKAFKMPTYMVTPKSNYCRHFAEVIKPSTPTDSESEYETDDEPITPISPSRGWFGFGKAPVSPIKEKVKKFKTNKQKSQSRGGNFDGLWVYLFPNNGVNCYSPAWYSLRVVPKSAGRTVLEYDIYQKKGSTVEEIEEFIKFLKEVEQEDYDLCEATQKNLVAGVYATGQLHPVKEQGVVFYQNQTKKMVMDHLQQEKERGEKIYPAFAGSKYLGEESKAADKMCKDLDCSTGKVGELVW